MKKPTIIEGALMGGVLATAGADFMQNRQIKQLEEDRQNLTAEVQALKRDKSRSLDDALNEARKLPDIELGKKADKKE